MLGEAVIYEGLVLIRPADEGPVIRRLGKDVEGLAEIVSNPPGARLIPCTICGE